MPITVTFDLDWLTPQELNRLRDVFDRLEWEEQGSLTARHARPREQQSPEDWFNHVLPALVVLRSFAQQATTAGRNICTFSMDALCPPVDTAAVQGRTPRLPADDIPRPQHSRSGQAPAQPRLHAWLDALGWPY